MKRNKLVFIFTVICAVVVGYGCAMRPDTPKPQTVVIPGGTVSPTLGVGFDVTYDAELDNVIPGYKIMTVAYTNNTMNIVQMDPVNDKWFVENRKGGKVKAVTNLRDKDPDVWSNLPRKLKILIEYPLLVSIGSTQTIDLLFPANINLNAFRSIIFKPGSTKDEFKIMPREE